MKRKENTNNKTAQNMIPPAAKTGEGGEASAMKAQCEPESSNTNFEGEGQQSPPEASADQLDEAEQRKQRKKGIILMTVIIAVMIAVIVAVMKPLLAVAGDSQTLEAYLEEWGSFSVLIYMGLVILQIIAAVVPGGPFEIAAGYLYGPFKGALICDLAMMIGSAFVFYLSRKIGRRFVYLFVSKEKLDSVRFLHASEKKVWILFLLFLIPGTPKDLLSYAAGLTDLKWGAWLFITGVGRFPAIYLSALSGTALENRDYGMFILVILVTVVLSFFGAMLYRRKNREKTE